ncbi:hypothetical protein [Sediminicola arcticus]|jgi:hypothetical protein|uniref:Uncharacterized protein n=1 Tax=Sediminicola arcticus TaxID=1574308 RepID=A0ABV2SS75_9FLAO
MMNLNQDQIQELYTFTRKHFVEHYDLQTEMVDHLANGIELQWKQTPTLTFHEALNKEFKKFGIFGFQDVISERVKAMEKRYRAIIWRFYREYFTLPKVVLTLFLTMIYFSLLRVMTQEMVYYFFVANSAGLMIPLFISSIRYRKKLNAKPRKWMMEEMIFNQMGLFNLGILPLHLLNLNLLSHRFVHNQWFLLALSFFLTCYILLFYIIAFIIPTKAEQLLSETYPEYKLA